MIPDIMTKDEVTAYLSVPATTLLQWIETGALPCEIINDRYFFRREDVDRLKESSPEVKPLFESAELPLSKVLFIPNTEKKPLLSRMVEVMAGSSREVSSRAELEKALFVREELMSTGVGLGIAIPHARTDAVAGLVLSAALVRDGVSDYQALDSVPVTLIFMIAARKKQHEQHLNMLARISGRLKQEPYRKYLIASSSAGEFHARLTGGK